MGHLPALAPYVAALALTLALEIPVYAALLHQIAGLRWRDGARLGLTANLVSHPLVFLIVAPLLSPRLGPIGALAAAEVAAVTVEAVVVQLVRRQDLSTAAGTSYVANAVSFCAGLLVFVR